ncbi:hypothetical protein [Pontivivens ytuae]|uniref:Uncharacterized protein n=1 Tax=Pontivivens ytuae TaxID=2789856 RepID=A0A7S9LRE2_9RHOB|nr:hypothetical protein [Pontivivens ytuae]QPH53590.1 hypothetical protein I0K15_17690 [Pontivivens ytuae]
MIRPPLAMLALTLPLILTACGDRDPEVQAPEPEPDLRVAVVEAVELGRTTGGWIVSVTAQDPRGVVQDLELEPAGRSGGLVVYDLQAETSETMQARVGQRGRVAIFVPNEDLAGATGVRVEGSQAGATALLPGIPEG